jgi:hypothetical protein
MSNFKSNSSSEIRKQIELDFVILPKINNEVNIIKFVNYAKRLVQQADNTYSKGEWNDVQSYIDYKKFLKVVCTEIPKHKSYLSIEMKEHRNWFKRKGVSALNRLECIVERMDLAEDRRRNNDLIDEFDCDEDTNFNDQPSPVIIQNNLLSSTDSLPNTNTFIDISSYNNINTKKISSKIADDYIEEPINTLERSTSNGVSYEDVEILKVLEGITNIGMPHPHTSTLELVIGNRFLLKFYRDDFHVSYDSFLQHVPPELQMCRTALETNRCFFVHLGVALNIHPFALQVAFRYFAIQKIQSSSKDDICREVLESVNEYAGFVDAYSLCFLWPIEFKLKRFCFISGSLHNPILSCFSQKGVDSNSLIDVIIHCDGSHFTLLRGMHSTLSNTLSKAQQFGHVVHINEVEVDQSVPSLSILSIIEKLRS